MSDLTIQIPEKLEPLWGPARYKGAYGGRGGAKSHFFAQRAIVRCIEGHCRIVCIREVQKSIKDSVKQLLVDKILAMGVGHLFDILDQEIRGHNGSLIIFRGMKSYNADTIKSLEAYDIAWVEEAQTLSAYSLELLRPTIRKEGSELWFSWNPTNKHDAVDVFLRKTPPPGAIVVPVGWQDNPWFPRELQAEMAHDFATDPDAAEHIWNGAYGAGKGAILAKWVNRADRDGRITEDVDYDPSGAGVEVSCDLGFRDTACFWFWQRKVGGFTVWDYDHDHGLDAAEWIDRIKNRLGDRKLTRIWLPHDANAKTFQSRETVMERFLRAFPGKIGAVPVTKKSDQISAARAVIDRCEFHKTRCEDGLDGLLAWEFDYNEDNQVFSREPLHNWASHRGDSFSYGCQVMQGLTAAKAEDKPRHLEVGAGNRITLNDAWGTQNMRGNRI